jgi:DNA invertase Pin-like site-specific DNA recombinase
MWGGPSSWRQAGPSLTPEQIKHAHKLIDKGEGRQYVADLLNVGRSTLDRALAG